MGLVGAVCSLAREGGSGKDEGLGGLQGAALCGRAGWGPWQGQLGSLPGLNSILLFLCSCRIKISFATGFFRT